MIESAGENEFKAPARARALFRQVQYSSSVPGWFTVLHCGCWRKKMIDWSGLSDLLQSTPAQQDQKNIQIRTRGFTSDTLIMEVLLRTGYSIVGRPMFIPMKAAQWRMKPKMTDFPGLKIPRSSATSAPCKRTSDSSSSSVCNSSRAGRALC